MADAMAHRGPDDSGFYFDPSIGLGQRRLSIIDIDGGRQPIPNEDGTIQLVCNGEIYNSPDLRRELKTKGHIFKTATDVEVILHLYEEIGRKCVNQLRGMFAFAIWDQKQGQLLLGRDHMGQKPLFYCQVNGAFLFASEVKGILASGLIQPEVDLDALWHFISLRFIPDDLTLFKGIQKLKAATTLAYQAGRISIETYWRPDFIAKHEGSENQIIDELDELLQETIRLHLLSDVRVGSFLSGGIDSGLVTAMMARATDEIVPSFSIGVKEESFNELPYADMVAQAYHLEAHKRVVSADLIDLIPAMIYHMDEPSDPFGVGVFLVSRLAGEHVKVVLGGDGGDENFAGYDRFVGNRLVDFYCLLPEKIRRSMMRKIIDRVPESFSYKSLAQKARWVNEMSLFSGGERYAQSMSHLRFTQTAKESLFTSTAVRQVQDRDSLDRILTFFNADNVDHLVDRMLYTDLSTRIPDHLLVISDRMSMAHSLEVRSPLLDYKIVEFAAAIPGAMKLKGARLKYVLRKVASRYLPSDLVHRKKQGFGFPIGQWLRADLRHFLVDLFNHSRFVEMGIFSRDYMRALQHEHLNGKVDHSYRLWLLINLEIWFRIYFENATIDDMRGFISRSRMGEPGRPATKAFAK